METADFERFLKRARTHNEATIEYLGYAQFYRKDSFTTIHFEEEKWYETFEWVKFILDSQKKANSIKAKKNAKTGKVIAADELNVVWRNQQKNETY